MTRKTISLVRRHGRGRGASPLRCPRPASVRRRRWPRRPSRPSRPQARRSTRGSLRSSPRSWPTCNGMFDFGQVMTDMVFSYGELGFQEFETQRYLGGILKENGFTVENGVAGIPSAWVAKWGSGRPVIALGSDVDCIPQASQKPGVAYPRPDRRRRARARRGPQLRHAAQHRGRHRRQAHHGAREAAGHDRHLARRRRRAARHQGLLRARRAVQGRRPGDVQPRRLQPRDRLGRRAAATA